jgi:indolepyruvate ferredoxin oxidoreductase beta subunit
MKTTSIMIVGVGGQGSLLASRLLGTLLTDEGYDVKVSEVHGMSQRGGSVVTYVRYGEKVYSPVIGLGAADAMVAFEKMEAVRYAPYLKPEGVAVINDFEMPSSTTSAGLADYPEGCLEAMQANFKCFALDEASIAENLGSAKCMNVVLFGAMTKVLGLDDIDWDEVIRRTVPAKLVELNLAAYRAGREAI